MEGDYPPVFANSTLPSKKIDYVGRVGRWARLPRLALGGERDALLLLEGSILWVHLDFVRERGCSGLSVF